LGREVLGSRQKVFADPWCRRI